MCVAGEIRMFLAHANKNDRSRHLSKHLSDHLTPHLYQACHLPQWSGSDYYVSDCRGLITILISLAGIVVLVVAVR